MKQLICKEFILTFIYENSFVMGDFPSVYLTSEMAVISCRKLKKE